MGRERLRRRVREPVDSRRQPRPGRRRRAGRRSSRRPAPATSRGCGRWSKATPPWCNASDVDRPDGAAPRGDERPEAGCRVPPLQGRRPQRHVAPGNPARPGVRVGPAELVPWLESKGAAVHSAPVRRRHAGAAHAPGGVSMGHDEQRWSCSPGPRARSSSTPGSRPAPWTTFRKIDRPSSPPRASATWSVRTATATTWPATLSRRRPSAVITAATLSAPPAGLSIKPRAEALKGRAGRTLPAGYSWQFGGADVVLIPRPGLHSDDDLIVYFPRKRSWRWATSCSRRACRRRPRTSPAYLSFLDDVLDVFPENDDVRQRSRPRPECRRRARVSRRAHRDDWHRADQPGGGAHGRADGEGRRAEGLQGRGTRCSTSSVGHAHPAGGRGDPGWRAQVGGRAAAAPW